MTVGLFQPLVALLAEPCADCPEQLHQQNQQHNSHQHHQILIAVIAVVDGDLAQIRSRLYDEGGTVTVRIGGSAVMSMSCDIKL